MLDQLGNSPYEVAQSLKSLGIQGVRNTVRFLNPIVRYARTQIPHALEMDVMTGTTLRIALPIGTKEVPLPEAVQVFLECFNQGKYPDLETNQ
jgi:hypothetical protein